MLKDGLFYTVMACVLVAFFIGNRVTEGSRGDFGCKAVRKILRRLNDFSPFTPKVFIAVICGFITTIVAMEQILGHSTGIVILLIMAAGTTIILAFVYYFCERLAEVFTYYWRKIRILDLTKKSKIVAFLSIIFIAAGLIDINKFNKKIDYLGRHDTTVRWIRKIANERREYNNRRCANQMRLRESRLRYDLRAGR